MEALLSRLSAVGPRASCLTFSSFRFFKCPLGVFIIPASRVDERLWKCFMNCECCSQGGIKNSEEGREGSRGCWAPGEGLS